MNPAGTRTDFLPVVYIDSQDWSAPFEVNVSAAAEIGPRAISLLGNNGIGAIRDGTGDSAGPGPL